MISQPDLSTRLAIDSKGVDSLRQGAKQNAPDAAKAAAQQFESLFMNMVMKSMRDASTQEGGLFDNQQSKMFTGMLDQQLSQNMAKRGVGLADVLIRQLSPAGSSAAADSAKAKGVLNHSDLLNGAATKAAADASLDSASSTIGNLEGDDALSQFLHVKPDTLKMYRDGTTAKVQPSASELKANPGLKIATANRQASVAAAGSAGAVADTARVRGNQPSHVKNFQEKLAAQAEEASQSTGIPAKFLLGQAALESGWGKREIIGANGKNSHNLFGIKATSGWKGKVVEATTTEYVNGVPHTKREKFRAYDSYADSFRDYAKLLSKNPRYENVIANAQDASSFARGLQRAGYATDPNYATKLTRIINNSLT